MEREGGDEKVTIYIDTDFSKAVDTSLTALRDKNNKAPRIFRFGGTAYRVIPDETGMMRSQRMDTKAMRHEVKNVARFVKTTEETFREVAPPTEVVDDILATPVLPFPVLGGIVSVPVYGADGKIKTTPGYDPSSKLFYAPMEGFEVPRVSPKPTEEEVEVALELLLDNLLVDFPFDGPGNGRAEKAHALCMILQPFARQLIDGSTPIYLIAKPTPGTGASKLVDIYSLITSGEKATAQTETKQEDELRKRITAVLAEGAGTFYLDNVNYRVDSSSLASVVTSATWSDRLLGETSIVRVPVKLTWIIAGNNPKLSSEIARRCVRIRLDAKMEQPEMRTTFKHKDLEAWVQKNHSTLVWACLTLIQNWIAKGRPAPNKSKGSFEAWARVMGGILQCAKIEGFLENEAEMRAAADDEGLAVKAFIGAWWDEFEDNPVFTGASAPGEGCLFDLIEEQDINLPIQGQNAKAQKTSLGMYVGKLDNRIFSIDSANGPIKVRVERAGSSKNATKWRLNPIRPAL